MMAVPNHHLAHLLFNVPLAIAPIKLEALLTALGPHMGISTLVLPDGSRRHLRGSDQPDPASRGRLENFGDRTDGADDRPYHLIDGIAVIPVHDTLVHRSRWVSWWWGLTSYEALSNAFHRAMDDDAVRGVFLDIDSPGGPVAGLFDFVDGLVARRGEKPIHAHANEFGASAAYAIASVADHVSTPRTGLVGSVGTVLVHWEFSAMLEEAGVTVTVMRSGSRKAEGNDLERLTETARDWLQSMLDETTDLFVETVARNRALKPSDILATDSALTTAREALDVGFIDAVMSTEDAAQHLIDRLA